LPNEPAPDWGIRGRPAEQGAMSAAIQPWQLGHRCYGQRVGEAERDREEEQCSEGGEVLGEPGWETHQEIPGMIEISMSMILIPMNGAMMPPSP
jgi:NADPH-dependent curcumin reductase CurA